jgi:cytochrome P450
MGMYHFLIIPQILHLISLQKFSLTSMDYSEKSKRQRKYLQSYFQKGRLQDYYPTQLREVHQLLNDLLDDPEDYRMSIRRYVPFVL